MTRYVTLEQVIALHDRVIAQSGGASGLRDPGALESAIAQPQMTFDSVDLYPTLAEKAASLAHALAGNHPFVDDNKRVAHAAMETMLVLNNYEVGASVDEQERMFLDVASGSISRAELAEWLQSHLVASPR